jgi:curli biogenesis system outer membrane secretion channel CsgG
MNKLIVPVAAALLAVSPAAAQQALEAPQSPSPAQQTQVQQPAQESRTPTVHVSRDEVRQRVQANEERLSNAQVTNTNWWWLVAAIAVGVIVAAIVL